MNTITDIKHKTRDVSIHSCSYVHARVKLCIWLVLIFWYLTVRMQRKTSSLVPAKKKKDPAMLIKVIITPR